jgi:hypothetical protein
VGYPAPCSIVPTTSDRQCKLLNWHKNLLPSSPPVVLNDSQGDMGRRVEASVCWSCAGVLAWRFRDHCELVACAPPPKAVVTMPLRCLSDRVSCIANRPGSHACGFSRSAHLELGLRVRGCVGAWKSRGGQHKWPSNWYPSHLPKM